MYVRYVGRVSQIRIIHTHTREFSISDTYFPHFCSSKAFPCSFTPETGKCNQLLRCRVLCTVEEEEKGRVRQTQTRLRRRHRRPPRGPFHSLQPQPHSPTLQHRIKYAFESPSSSSSSFVDGVNNREEREKEERLVIHGRNERDQTEWKWR